MKAFIISFLLLFVGLGISSLQSVDTQTSTSEDLIAKGKKKPNNRNRKKGNQRKPQKVDATVQKRHELHSKEDDKKMAELTRIGQAAIGGAAPATTPQAAAANAALEKMRKQGSGFDIPKPKPPAKGKTAKGKKK